MNKTNTHFLNLTDEDLNIVFEALVELPYKKSAPTIDRMNRQLFEEAQRREQAVKEQYPEKAKNELKTEANVREQEAKESAGTSDKYELKTEPKVKR